jgi:hypothetical protein
VRRGIAFEQRFEISTRLSAFFFAAVLITAFLLALGFVAFRLIALRRQCRIAAALLDVGVDRVDQFLIATVAARGDAAGYRALRLGIAAAPGAAAGFARAPPKAAAAIGDHPFNRGLRPGKILIGELVEPVGVIVLRLLDQSVLVPHRQLVQALDPHLVLLRG